MHGALPKRILVKVLLVEVDYHFDITEVIHLLLTVSYAVFVYGIAHVSVFLMHVVARHKDKLYPLMLVLVRIRAPDVVLIRDVVPVDTV